MATHATLVRICDLAGRPRGVGFAADHLGTVVTSHETVDGLVRAVLHAPGERTWLAEADAIVPLPEQGLALVHTEGLGVRPLPISRREQIEPGAYVRLCAHGWRTARILGRAQVTYTATDRFHLLDDAVELAMGTAGSDALRLGGEAAGGPVLDAATGAVLAVVGTALEAGRLAAGFALPLCATQAAEAGQGPLGELLRRNETTVPGYGRDLNLAAVLELTATSAGSCGGPADRPGLVERSDVAREFSDFEQGVGALVMGLVGEPGTGRTTELAAFAERRAHGPEPAPTLWLRGADLRADDASIADAAARALQRASRIVSAPGPCGAHGAAGSSVACGAVDVSGLSGRSGPRGAVDAGGGGGPRGSSGAAGSSGAVGEAGRSAVSGSLGGAGEGGLSGLCGLCGVVGPCGGHGGADSSRPCAAGSSGEVGGGGWSGVSGSLGGAGEGGLSGLCGLCGVVGPCGGHGGADSSRPCASGSPGAADGGGRSVRSGPRGVADTAGPAGASSPYGPSGPCLAAATAAAADAVGPSGVSGPVGPYSETGPTGGSGVTSPCGPSGCGASGACGGCGAVGPHMAPGEAAAVTPQQAAAVAAAAGRPLVLLLDSPEEMPPALAHRLPDWTAGTVQWLASCGVRMAVACRPEHWEQAGALYPADVLHLPARTTALSTRACGPSWPPLPPAVRIGPLAPGDARLARDRYGLPAGALAAADERHPLALRLLADVRAALPGPTPGRPGRYEIFAAYLDLMCLRVAVRVAAAADPPLRGSAVRRLAARVSGRVHEAARRCLGPGQGELARKSFEELFPWRTGWASAVLTEGLLAPAGRGYRFAHEEVADWVQGAHLDLDAALHALVHRWHTRDSVGLPSRPGGPPHSGPYAPPSPRAVRPLPVPRHRIGPVVQALLLLDRTRRPDALSERLAGLVDALDRLDDERSGNEAGDERSGDERFGNAMGDARGAADARWWGARLLRETLLRVPDAGPYLPVLRLLADRIARRAAAPGGAAHELGGPDAFGPGFVKRLRLTEAERFELFRRLVPADPPPGDGVRPRYLDAVAQRLAAAPRTVLPLLCRWFGDDTPLPAGPDARVRPTVAAAAQALLYTCRGLAVDDLTEALVATAHPRADELLASLAEDEPSALCRAVERWAHDPRPERRVAAAAYGLTAADRAAADADRELLRCAALALLSRPGDTTLHGAALALLVRDPRTRPRYLGSAVAAFAAGDPRLPATSLAAALPTHPEQVLGAFEARLRQSADGAGEIFEALAQVASPQLARRAGALVRDYAARRPEGAAQCAAAFVDRRLEDGPAARAVLFPLVTGLLRGRSPQVRQALAAVLAAPGGPASRPLRAELLDLLLHHEQYEAHDLAVLAELLRAAALGAGQRAEERTRALVHRVGMLLVRTPEGAVCFDRRLVELAREVPGFASLVCGWLAGEPEQWSAVVGPSAWRTLETLGGGTLACPQAMRTDRLRHGTLRPA